MVSERSFVDLWLLEDPSLLETWGAPHLYQQLNAFEKCILAMLGGPAEAALLATEILSRVNKALKNRWAMNALRLCAFVKVKIVSVFVYGQFDL